MSSSPDPLENVVHQALRSLPECVAAPSLEIRVLAEIARRQRLPWWRHSWAQWPLSVRGAFLVTGLLLSGAIIFVSLIFIRTGPVAFLGPLRFAPLAEVATLLRACGAVGRVLSVAGHLLSAHAPREIIFGFCVLYACVLTLAAAAYRTLVRSF
jgi:hypothetical protein